MPKNLKSIYNSTIRDWEKVIKLVDPNNEIDFETFKDSISSHFDKIDDYILNDLCEFITVELGAYCDAELVDLTEDDISLIIDYINN